MKIDYKVLLKKYISYVEDCEGVDCIRWGNIDRAEGFTQEEKTELAKISDEVGSEEELKLSLSDN